MNKLEGVIKVTINNRIIYCNTVSYDHMDLLNNNDIDRSKPSNDDINYTCIEMLEDDTHGK